MRLSNYYISLNVQNSFNTLLISYILSLYEVYNQINESDIICKHQFLIECKGIVNHDFYLSINHNLQNGYYHREHVLPCEVCINETVYVFKDQIPNIGEITLLLTKDDYDQMYDAKGNMLEEALGFIQVFES